MHGLLYVFRMDALKNAKALMSSFLCILKILT